MSVPENDWIWEQLQDYLEMQVITEEDIKKVENSPELGMELLEVYKKDFDKALDEAAEIKKSDWDDSLATY